MTMEQFEKTPFYTLTNTLGIPLIELAIGHCGYEIKTSEQIISNMYPAYRLHYIVKGTMYCRFPDGRELPLSAHTCYLIRPDINICYRSKGDDPASHYWLSFNGQNAKNYIEKMGFSAHCPAIPIPEEYRDDIHRAFYDCLSFPKNQIKFTDFVFLENFMKITRLLAVITDSGDRQTKKAPIYIEQALSYFNAHYTEPDFTIHAVAQTLYIHENYLSAVFKAYMGITFKDYLCRRRTDLALSLIRQGYTSVHKIAQMVGIPDPSYFSKFFKRHNGRLPSEEIKIAQGNFITPPRKVSLST